MACRGVRGATTVESNSRDEILEETRKLLALMIRINDIKQEDVASAVFLWFSKAVLRPSSIIFIP